MKNIIVLSGGGLASAYQLGVIEELLQHDVSIDAIFGTSGGAINANMIAQNKFKDLKGIWKDIALQGNTSIIESDIINVDTRRLNIRKLLSIILPNWKYTVKAIFSKNNRNAYVDKLKENLSKVKYFCNTNPLYSKLLKHIDIESYTIPCYFNFVDYNGGEHVITNNKDYDTSSDLASGVLASASIPIFFNGVRVKTKDRIYPYAIDGGTYSNILLSEAIKYIKSSSDSSEYNIIVVSCSTGNSVYEPDNSIFTVLGRILTQIMINSMYKKELNASKIISSVIKGTTGRNKLVIDKTKYITPNITVIEPSLPLGHVMDNNIELFVKRFELGVKDCKTIFNFQ